VDSVKDAKRVFDDSFCKTIRCGVAAIHYRRSATGELDRPLIKTIENFYFIKRRVFEENKEMQSFDGAKGIILFQNSFKSHFM
jgi:hypothetical protein